MLHFTKHYLILKHRNKALWNGTHGGQMKKATTNDQKMCMRSVGKRR